VMSTLMSGSYAGMAMIVDYKQGVLNRFLVSPVQRSSIIFGPLLQNAVTMVIQALIMILLALAIGARFTGGISGVLVLIVCSVLLGVAFGALSMALALIVRKEEGLTSAVAFFTMPLMFLSGLFMPLDLVPGWIQTLAKFNPVNWAIEAGREALAANADWGSVLIHTGYLTLFLVLSSWLATQAFRHYQRSS
jgi:ABC-2 type transport system permease protein